MYLSDEGASGIYPEAMRKGNNMTWMPSKMFKLPRFPNVRIPEKQNIKVKPDFFEQSLYHPRGKNMMLFRKKYHRSISM